MSHEDLPARTETWTCQECERSYPSALAASRCEQRCDAYTD